MNVCAHACIFGAVTTTIALHKRCNKIIQLTAEDNLTFLSVYYVPN